MASSIDATKPLDGVPAVKGDLRNNLGAAKSEIEALQATVATALQPTLTTSVLAAGFSITGYGSPGVTRGAGSVQPTMADSGKWITSDGAITIPTTTGFHCTLEFGGDHDVTFNGQTWNTGSGAGDIVSVYVKSATTIRITPIILAVNVITEGDFV